MAQITKKQRVKDMSSPKNGLDIDTLTIAQTHRQIRSQSRALANFRAAFHGAIMFTIEHEFDATVITLVDEGEAPLQEDITINSFAECVTLEQLDPRTDRVQKITLSPEQLRDLAAALDLPEGVYALRRSGDAQ